MIYVLDLGYRVLLAGSVATPAMLAEGWKPYYGKVPLGNYLKFDSNGWLVAVTEEE